LSEGLSRLGSRGHCPFYFQHWIHLSFGCIRLCQQSPRCTPLSIYPYRRRERSSPCLNSCLQFVGSEDLTVKRSNEIISYKTKSTYQHNHRKRNSEWTDGCWSTCSDASLGAYSSAFLFRTTRHLHPSRLRLSQLTSPVNNAVREQPRSTACASLYVVGRVQSDGQGHPSRQGIP
jgi:hypothetical protein